MTDLAELRRQIEELALRTVVGEPACGAAAAEGWIAALEEIRAQAAASEPPVAAVAAETIEALRLSLARSANPGDPLQEGITRLQNAVEEQGKAAPAEMSLAQDPELFSDFLLESREHLAAIEAQVLTLERDPHDREALNAVFRGFHTIKGLAGFLELWDVQKLSHEVETVLDSARNLRLDLTPAAIDVILESADHLRRWLTHLEAAMQGRPPEPPPAIGALLERIRALAAAPAAADPGTAAGLPAMAVALESGGAPPATAGDPPVTGGDLPAAGGDPPATAGDPPVTGGDLPATGGDLPANGGDPAAPIQPAARASQRSEAMAVKVNTAKLDYLVDMAGEMVIAESLVRHDPDLASIKSPRLQRNLAHLTRITVELQRTSMAMRLVPIGPLFRRMARLVRDLARQFGKQVQMDTEGDEIELDRNIVEELADPLMHMVRNALDHGIETAAERIERGKSATARLLLRAHHQAGQVVIEVVDDGRGLDRERIAAKAIERGLIAAGEGLSDSEVYNQIFQPGFSTAAQVTSVSGRGVGMDVVRRHIEKLRGRIEIRSTPGAGTAFSLKLPLTLAIIDGLVVGVGRERYIVPLFAVRELFRPGPDTVWTVRQRAEMALVRDTLLPVLRLYRKFRVQPRTEDPAQSVLVVAESEGQRFCLLVDDLIGKQEVVIKSLGDTFKEVAGVAGGAILGDGRVGLILDLDRLYKERNADAIPCAE